MTAISQRRHLPRAYSPFLKPPSALLYYVGIFTVPYRQSSLDHHPAHEDNIAGPASHDSELTLYHSRPSPDKAHTAVGVAETAGAAIGALPFPPSTTSDFVLSFAASGFRGKLGSYPTALTIPRPFVLPSRNNIRSPTARNSGRCTKRNATVALSPVRM